MAMTLTILYRGRLSSCNYDCSYCPLTKRSDTPADLAADRDALERLTRWVETHSARALAVFFTPSGEAMIHPWYQQAVVRMSRCGHVRKVAVQTNLSGSLDWAERCVADRVALWCTFHPRRVRREAFLAQCRRLDARGVRYSVGMVGLRRHIDDIEAMRRELPASVYLWVNACKSRPDYYAAADLGRLTAVDPLFPISAQHHPSRGKACRCGESVIAVDAEGTIRQCHFAPAPLGNLYADPLEAILKPRTCPNETCGCHIGYVHMPGLGGERTFGDGILERIPRGRGARSCFGQAGDLPEGSSDARSRPQPPLADARPHKPTPNTLFPAEAILDPFTDVLGGVNSGKIGKMCRASGLRGGYRRGTS